MSTICNYNSSYINIFEYVYDWVNIIILIITICIHILTYNIYIYTYNLYIYMLYVNIYIHVYMYN